MTRVDFYVLPVAEPHARLSFACRLVEKAWFAGHRVYLHSAQAQTADAIDGMLWSFRDSAFVPHEAAPANPACPVVIGQAQDPGTFADVLINLADEVPAFFERFARVAEIVLDEPAARSAGRARWAIYREHGCQPDHHDMQSLRSAGERG